MTLSLPIERQREIANRIARNGAVQLRSLLQDFATSEDTLRRDLRELERQGLCRCVYGGAVTVAHYPADAHQRRSNSVDRKNRLGKLLADCIESSQVVFFDSGSTNLSAALQLPRLEGLTTITHDPSIAAALASRNASKVISIGGQINSFVGAALDATAMKAIVKLKPDVVILGCCAIHTSFGMMAFNYEDCEIKQALVENSDRVVTAALNEKLQTSGPYFVCETSRLSDIALEPDAPEMNRSAFAKAGIAVKI